MDWAVLPSFKVSLNQLAPKLNQAFCVCKIGYFLEFKIRSIVAKVAANYDNVVRNRSRV